MKQWIHECLNQLLPSYCPVCKSLLQRPGEALCLKCESEMPLTGYSSHLENPVARIFWAYPQVVSATSLFYFEKRSPYQVLFHNLKYRGDRKIGLFLGRLLALDLQGTPYLCSDRIIPMPLHRTRKRERGYNQSSLIASGLSQVAGIPVEEKLLIRSRETPSQTNKSRLERWENTLGAFHIAKSSSAFQGKTLLLIDDIITTGATLEAAVQALTEIPEVKIHIATIACA